MKTSFTTGAKILFFSLVLGIGTAYVNAEWVPPCGDPESGCNALPPVHEGSESQVKEGGLSVNALGVRAGAVAGYVLTATDENGTAEWAPASGGIGNTTHYYVGHKTAYDLIYGSQMPAGSIKPPFSAASGVNFTVPGNPKACMLTLVNIDSSGGCRIYRQTDGKFIIRANNVTTVNQGCEIACFE